MTATSNSRTTTITHHHLPVEQGALPLTIVRSGGVGAAVVIVEKGGLILGVCNGFQLMVKLGLLPGFDRDYATQRVTLTHNDSGRFEDRWVHLRINGKSPCIFTRGLGNCYLPVRHGEGKFIAIALRC